LRGRGFSGESDQVTVLKGRGFSGESDQVTVLKGRGFSRAATPAEPIGL